MEELIIVLGVLFLLAWLFIYFKFFRNEEKTEDSSELSLEHNKEGKNLSVAPWGDDNNVGTLTNPWKTLQHAIDNLVPGDMLLIREGVYREHLSLKKSGTSENPIVISVFQGEEAVLDGDGIDWKYGFNFEFGVSFVTLSGLKVKNFKEYGIALWGDNRSIELKDVEVLGCGAGTHVISARDLLVEDCKFHNNSGPGFVVSPGPLNKARIVHTSSSYNYGPELPDGFLLDSGEDIVIEKCTAEYNAGSGFKCSTSNTTVSACISRDNAFYGVNCIGDGCKMINCIIDHNEMAGVSLQGGGLHELYNNLVVNCGEKGDYGLSAVHEGGASSFTRVALVNNIFAFNNGGVHFGSSAVVEKENYNIYWSREDTEISNGNRRYSRNEINERVWFKETGQGEQSFCRDPLFVDPSGHDFRLVKNSPAIDRGDLEGAPGTDFDGSVRPQGRGVDIGPYESPEGSLIPPTAEIIHTSPYSSDISNSLKFTVKWRGFVEGRKVESFNIQFKDGVKGTWQNWLAEIKEDKAEFIGAGGHTYYFRVRAKDDLGNWGNWSDTWYIVVPADDQSPLIRYEGDWGVKSSQESYLNTLHYSVNPGSTCSLRLTGTEVAWISTLGPDLGQALVYIDDVLQTTVDLYAEDVQHRQPVFVTPLDGKPHTICIEVSETKNEKSKGYRVDVDGIAVKL